VKSQLPRPIISGQLAVRDICDATRDVTECVECVEPSPRQPNVPPHLYPFLRA
jgi:hypothetical protein